MLIQDRNNPTYVNNPTASARLNMSVSTAKDYTSARATKYRITYIDNTTVIGQITSSITNNIATFTFDLFVSKPIITIDIISEDEATIYQTIDGSSLTPGKLYNITQDCYVE